MVGDDCSTDRALRSFPVCEQQSKITLIQPDKNHGIAANANFCVSKAGGDYIALLHHDDHYRPDLVTKWVQYADPHPTIGFVTNAYGIYGTDQIDYHNLSGDAPFNGDQTPARPVGLSGQGNCTHSSIVMGRGR